MTLDETLGAALARLAGTRRLLVASDFDGVIAPIVDDPTAVVGLPATIAALGRLARMAETEVALVSGRSLDFLQSLAWLPDDVWLAGSHGAELGHREAGELTPSQRNLLSRITTDLRHLAEHTDGASVETKVGSVAFHYRLVDPAQVHELRSTILDGPGSMPGVEVKPGKMVIELAVFDATKGTALTALRADTEPTATIYFGDDVTDEDGFAALGPTDVSVKVGDGDTLARFRVADPEAVAGLLTILADERAARSRPGSTPS